VVNAGSIAGAFYRGSTLTASIWFLVDRSPTLVDSSGLIGGVGSGDGVFISGSLGIVTNDGSILSVNLVVKILRLVPGSEGGSRPNQVIGDSAAPKAVIRWRA
jgi:hypothetical protein